MLKTSVCVESFNKLYMLNNCLSLYYNLVLPAKQSTAILCINAFAALTARQPPIWL